MSASGPAVVSLALAESPQQVGGLSLRPRATRQRAHAATTALSLLGSKCVVWSASSVAQGAGGVDRSVELRKESKLVVVAPILCEPAWNGTPQ